MTMVFPSLFPEAIVFAYQELQTDIIMIKTRAFSLIKPGFIEPGKLIDGDLELVLVKRRSANPRKALVPAYIFHMRLAGTKHRVGQIDLRIGNTEMVVKYGGHMGYGVKETYRGRRFAARGIRLLFPLAREHGLNPLWITCNPDNIASRRSCEIAGGKYIEVVDIPRNSNLYLSGDRQKCRYRFDI